MTELQPTDHRRLTNHDRKDRHTMDLHAEHRLHLANQRIAERVRSSARARLAQPRQTSLRRSVGRSLIRIGERVAAEPNLRPARPLQG